MGTITSVQFYRDVNGNGTIDASDRLLGSGVKQTGTNDWRLTFATTGFAVGNNAILVRAKDNNTADSETVSTTINITNAAPIVTSATVAPATVPFLGQNITITAVGARDTDGTIAQVQFYLETSGDSALDTDDDTLIGTDASATGGFTLTAATLAATGFAQGVNRVYAVVIDNDGGSTTVTQTFTITAVNAIPTIATLTAPDAGRGTSFMITAGTVADTDGTVSRVEFYVDVNGNDELDIGVDRLLGTAVPTAGTARLTTTATGAGLTLGAHTIFARAQDNRQVFGNVTSGTVNITNNVPTITSVTDTPDPVVTIGNNLTLTAVGVADRDGTIAQVRFYRDNGDNVFDAMTDTLLGSDASATGGYTLSVSTAMGFAEGVNRYFAQVVDNDGGLSTAATTTGRINSRPTIDSVNTPTAVNRGQNVTLTASTVTDLEETGFTGTVTAVRFYRDVNGNGTIEAADRLLGTGVKQTGTNDWRITFATTGFAAGDNTILVQATDNNTAVSLVSTTIVAVNNLTRPSPPPR